MTLIAGPTGIGKTFIKRDVYEHHVYVVWTPERKGLGFDIRELFEKYQSQELAYSKSDLHHQQRVFNRILALAGRKVFVQQV